MDHPHRHSVAAVACHIHTKDRVDRMILDSNSDRQPWVVAMDLILEAILEAIQEAIPEDFRLTSRTSSSSVLRPLLPWEGEVEEDHIRIIVQGITIIDRQHHRLHLNKEWEKTTTTNSWDPVVEAMEVDHTHPLLLHHDKEEDLHHLLP
jgi:hypothetical protein